jgi:hypothetical protein
MNVFPPNMTFLKPLSCPSSSSPPGAALTRAGAYGFLAVAKLLHSKGADLEGAGTKYQMTALLRATVNGELDIVKFLANAGADLNAVDYNGDTAIVRAAKGTHTDIARYLMRIGAVIEENFFQVCQQAAPDCWDRQHEQNEFCESCLAHEQLQPVYQDMQATLALEALRHHSLPLEIVNAFPAVIKSRLHTNLDEVVRNFQNISLVLLGLYFDEQCALKVLSSNGFSNVRSLIFGFVCDTKSVLPAIHTLNQLLPNEAYECIPIRAPCESTIKTSSGKDNRNFIDDDENAGPVHNISPSSSVQSRGQKRLQAQSSQHRKRSKQRKALPMPFKFA